MPLGVIAAIIAMVASVLIEWNFAPFRVDASLSYFVTNLSSVIPSHLAMIGVGTFFGFWFGRGR